MLLVVGACFTDGSASAASTQGAMPQSVVVQRFCAVQKTLMAFHGELSPLLQMIKAMPAEIYQHPYSVPKVEPLLIQLSPDFVEQVQRAVESRENTPETLARLAVLVEKAEVRAHDDITRRMTARAQEIARRIRSGDLSPIHAYHEFKNEFDGFGIYGDEISALKTVYLDEIESIVNSRIEGIAQRLGRGLRVHGGPENLLRFARDVAWGGAQNDSDSLEGPAAVDAAIAAFAVVERNRPGESAERLMRAMPPGSLTVEQRQRILEITLPERLNLVEPRKTLWAEQKIALVKALVDFGDSGTVETALWLLRRAVQSNRFDNFITEAQYRADTVFWNVFFRAYDEISAHFAPEVTKVPVSRNISWMKWTALAVSIILIGAAVMIAARAAFP